MQSCKYFLRSAYIVGTPTQIGPEWSATTLRMRIAHYSCPTLSNTACSQPTDAAHVCRKRGRKGRGQDTDEAYTDDEAISESDSDDDRLPAVSAQEASADDLSSGKPKLPMLFHRACSSALLSNSQACFSHSMSLVASICHHVTIAQ